MIFKKLYEKYKMSENILYFNNEILNERTKEKIKELMSDKKQQQLFIASLYDIAVKEYVKDEDIKETLKENQEKINFTVFKTLVFVSKE